MDFKDSLPASARLRARSAPRVFSDPRDDSPGNIEAWREGIAAARAGDGPALARALASARGQANPIGSRGTPRRDPVSKAILALRADPQAWRRLRTSLRRWELWGADSAPAEAWQPGGVDMLSCAWAIAPGAVAAAARAWRENCQAQGKWWSCPFLARRYEGPAELSGALRQALNAHHPERTASTSTSADLPIDEAARGPERRALADILTETARGSIDSLWGQELDARARRERGDAVWERGGGEWGLDWARAWESADPASSAPAAPGCAERAVDAAMAEAAALSPDAAGAMAARLALSLREVAGGALSLRALKAWADSDPLGARDLPFGPFDWMHALQVSRWPATDEQLGRWLAGPGASWEAPAHLERSGALRHANPSWRADRRPWGSDAESQSMPDLLKWTPLEWMALHGRPGAALSACHMGAALRPSFEAAILAVSRWDFPTPKAEVLALAEACRIAEAVARPAASSPRPPPRL